MVRPARETRVPIVVFVAEEPLIALFVLVMVLLYDLMAVCELRFTVETMLFSYCCDKVVVVYCLVMTFVTPPCVTVSVVVFTCLFLLIAPLLEAAELN